MGPGYADGRLDEVLQAVWVVVGSEGESRQDAAADVEVLVGDEFAERGVLPSGPEVGGLGGLAARVLPPSGLEFRERLLRRRGV